MKAAKKKPSPARARASGKPQGTVAALPAAQLTALLTGRSESLLLSPALLVPNPENRRGKIDPKAPENVSLLESVKSVGVTVPLIVRPHPKQKGKFEIRAGERRHWAATQAKLATVPVTCWYELTETAAQDLTAVENTQRADLAPFEDAQSVIDMLARHGNDTAAVARILGKEPHWVVCRARLMRLNADWRKAWAEPLSLIHEWTIRHMELIARLEPQAQIAAYAAWHDRSAPGTRGLQSWIDESLLHRLASAPFSPEDATLLKSAGSCDGCKKRTSAEALLFQDLSEPSDTSEKADKSDRCTDALCWGSKLEAWFKQRKAALKAKHCDDLLLIDPTRYFDSPNRRAEAAKKHGGEVLSADRFQVAGAKAPGVKPALVVEGPDKGALKWVQLGTARSTRSARSGQAPQSDTPLTEKQGGKLLEERRGLLDKKRWFETLRLAHEEVAKLPFEKLPASQRGLHSLFCLAAVFGLNHKNDQPGNFHDRTDGSYRSNGTDPWPLLVKWQAEPHDPEKPCAAAAELWKSLRAVLAERLCYIGNLTQTPDESIQDCPKVCALVGLDVEAFRAQAAETYKEPKTWKSIPGYKAETTKDAKGAKGETAGSRKDAKAQRAAGKDTFDPADASDVSSAVAEAHKCLHAVSTLDGEELLIMPGATKGSMALYLLDGEHVALTRLGARKWPDRTEIADIEDDLREYAEAHKMDLKHPKE